MIRSRNTVVCLIGGLFLSCLAVRGLAADAVDHAAVLAPFVNDDTFAVLYVDVASLKVPNNPSEFLNLLPKLSDEAQAGAYGIMIASSVAKRFQDAGGQGVYVVAGLGDVHIGGGPVVVATTRQKDHLEAVEQTFHALIRKIAKDVSPASRTFFQELDVRRKGDVLLLGSKRVVARYAALQPAARADLLDPITKLSRESAVAAAVFCPGPDFRRVVRELWPNLPGSLAPLRGELADRWLHLEAAVNLPPDAKPRLALQAKDAEAAALFAKLWQDLPTATTEFGGPGKQREQVKGYAQLLVDALPAKVEGTRVVFGLPSDEARIAKLRAMIGEATDASMESSRRNERMNQFKQLALALLNFESAKKHLPPAAICDKEGRPLLSWRVAILPYIEEGDLYKQFHLDEPWDSPHNRALIEKMPAVYADPDPKYKELANEGKTTFQVPAGLETIFYNKEGATIREITDGTSKTIALVEVEPLRAVVWTKPEDWEVDLQHPRRGVERTDRNRFVAAWCDGSVQYVPVEVDEATLRALLTRTGGEVVDRP